MKRLSIAIILSLVVIFTGCGSIGSQGKQYAKKTESHECVYESYETIREASCSQPGERVGTCKICGSKSYEKIPKLEHDFEEYEIVREPDCALQGSKMRTCRVCGYKSYEEIPKRSHTPGEWEVVREATINSDGLKAIKCISCGECLETETIKYVEKPVVFNTVSGNGNLNMVLSGFNTRKWYQVSFVFDARSERSTYICCKIHNVNTGSYDLAVNEAISSGENHIFTITHLIEKRCLGEVMLFEVEASANVSWSFLVEEISLGQ